MSKPLDPRSETNDDIKDAMAQGPISLKQPGYRYPPPSLTRKDLLNNRGDRRIKKRGFNHGLRNLLKSGATLEKKLKDAFVQGVAERRRLSAVDELNNEYSSRNSGSSLGGKRSRKKRGIKKSVKKSGR